MSTSHRRLTHFNRGAGVNGTAGVSGGGFSDTAAAGCSAPPVISVRSLTKHYGQTHAVRGIDLEVRDGEIFAFLGPTAPARPPRPRSWKASAGPPAAG
jgi:ABC-type glutathione transport system ATPase component